MAIVYKIGHKNYDPLTPSGIDGRWTSDGRKVIYCADSIALAFLENMIRRQGVGFNRDFKTILIDIPDDLKIEVILAENLAAGWRHPKDYTICQQHGNKWYDKRKTPLFKVPSAVLPSSNNYVINNSHPDFRKIKIISISDLIPDDRIEDILKNYRKGI